MPQVSERAAAPLASASAISSAREVASRGSAYLLAVITLAGAVLRLLHLGAKSLWIDEPLTVAIARMPWPHFVSNWRHGEAAFQGVYFLLMRGWLHLGRTEFWIRLPSALFAIASIPVLYMVARALIGERVALVATLLFALNPTDVYYSQEARGYTMAILLVLASTWFFVCAVQEEREHDWILWVVFSVLSFYSQLLTCFVLVAQAASLLAFRRDTKRWRPMLLHALLIVVLCAPGLVFVLRAQAGGLPQSDWPRATPKQWLHLAMFLGGSGEKVVLFAILWAAAVRTIWRQRLLKHPREVFWHGALLISWAILPAILLALFSLYSPLFVQRYMIFSLPGTIMLAAQGAAELRRWNLGTWLVMALCLSSIVNVFMGYHKPREDWRSATAALLASASNGDAVLVYPPYARTGFDYYYDLHGNNAPRVRVFAQYYDFGEDQQTLLRAVARDPHAFPHIWVLLRDRTSGKDTLQDYSAAVARQLQSQFGDPRKYKFQGLTMLEFSR